MEQEQEEHEVRDVREPVPCRVCGATLDLVWDSAAGEIVELPVLGICRECAHWASRIHADYYRKTGRTTL